MKGSLNKLSCSIIVSFFIAVFITSCAPMPVTRVDVQSFDVEKAGVTKEQALTALTSVFVDRGFDVKFADAEAGVITTEYKKFAAAGTNPPFDYYMQIRGRISDVGGNMAISLSPLVKEQNRMNVAAFTEHELSYYTGESENLRYIDSMREGVGWRALAQVLFMNVVHDTAEILGLRVDDVKQNVTKTPANALLVD